jgi:hypothetical protein
MPIHADLSTANNLGLYQRRRGAFEMPAVMSENGSAEINEDLLVAYLIMKLNNPIGALFLL